MNSAHTILLCLSLLTAGLLQLCYSEPICSQTPTVPNENQPFSLACSGRGIIQSIDFASYGTPGGDCTSGHTHEWCESALSVSVLKTRCLGKQSCAFVENNGVFGDPCYGTPKRLAVKATCAATDDCPELKGYVSFNTVGKPSSTSISASLTQSSYQTNFSEHTVSMRFRAIEATSGAQLFFATDGSLTCALQFSDANLNYQCGSQLVSIAVPTLNKWHTVSATRTAARLTIQIDGGDAVVANSASTDDLHHFNAMNLGINYHGDMNEVMVFYKALAPADLATILVYKHSDPVYSDFALEVFFPFYSFDMTNVAGGYSKGGDAQVPSAAYASGYIIGNADLTCDSQQCSYRHEVNKLFDTPTMITADDTNSSRSGFFGNSVFKIQIRVPKHLLIKQYASQYNFASTLSNWAGTFVDMVSGVASTNTVCTGAWTVAEHPTDACSAMITYTTSDYGSLSSTCGFSSSQAGLPANGNEVGVFGKAQLQLFDAYSMSCSAHNLSADQTCLFSNSQTYPFLFVTWFTSHVTAAPLPVTVFDTSTAISAVTSSTVSTAQFDVNSYKYTAISMSATLKTFVNWPYKLVPRSPISTQVTNDLVTITEATGSSSGQCGGSHDVGFTGTCMQLWNIVINATASGTLGKPLAGLNMDTTISMHLLVHATNNIITDYNLPDFNVVLKSGDLTPSTTEHVDTSNVHATLTSCHSDFTPANNFTCTDATPATSFVRSAASGNSPTQTAYFLVKPTTTKGTIKSCQLLKVTAYPTSNLANTITVFYKSGSSWGLETLTGSQYPYGGGANMVWIHDPVAVNGNHLDYDLVSGSGYPVCTFHFDVLREYFYTIATSSISWTFVADIFVQFVGESVTPYSASKSHMQARFKLMDSHGTVASASSGKLSTTAELGISVPKSDLAASGSTPDPQAASSNCNSGYPAGTFIGSCVGIGVGALMIGWFTAYGMSSKSRAQSKSSDNTAAFKEEKHLALAPSNANASAAPATPQPAVEMQTAV